MCRFFACRDVALCIMWSLEGKNRDEFAFHRPLPHLKYSMHDILQIFCNKPVNSIEFQMLPRTSQILQISQLTMFDNLITISFDCTFFCCFHRLNIHLFPTCSNIHYVFENWKHSLRNYEWTAKFHMKYSIIVSLFITCEIENLLVQKLNKCWHKKTLFCTSSL